MLKTNKSFQKRIKVTKKGKVLSRKPGHCHFNARQKRSDQLKKKGLTDFNISAKKLNQFLPYK